jgi:DNA polymerase III delta subunit
MITLLTGENSFETTRTLKKIEAAFDGVSEHIDGSELELKQLPDLLMGATLFADKRLVVIKNLSESKAVWGSLGEWLGRVSDDVHLVLVEPKPDKRTKTYKDLQKVADIHEAKLWSDRDETQAEQWVAQEAKALGFEMDKKSAHLLVQRVGVDQWQLAQALEKLVVVGVVTPEVIEDLIEANPIENVFNLLDSALKGDTLRVKKMLENLETSEDPYRLFGLLGTQVFQLAALGVGDKSSGEVAKDLGAHPFALSKLAPHAKRLGRHGVQKAMAAMAEADQTMKISAAEPWLLIERALIKIACI